MLTGFWVKDVEFEDADEVLEFEFDVTGGNFVILEVVLTDSAVDSDSESELETAVSQLSSQDVALSISDDEAVVPESVDSVDCTDSSSLDIAVSAA